MSKEIFLSEYENFLNQTYGRVRLCAACGYYYSHPLNYCFKCPGRIVHSTITNRQYKEILDRQCNDVFPSAQNYLDASFRRYLNRPYPQSFSDASRITAEEYEWIEQYWAGASQRENDV